MTTDTRPTEARRALLEALGAAGTCASWSDPTRTQLRRALAAADIAILDDDGVPPVWLTVWTGCLDRARLALGAVRVSDHQSAASAAYAARDPEGRWMLLSGLRLHELGVALDSGWSHDPARALAWCTIGPLDEALVERAERATDLQVSPALQLQLLGGGERHWSLAALEAASGGAGA
jgi:hypothetical protein